MRSLYLALLVFALSPVPAAHALRLQKLTTEALAWEYAIAPLADGRFVATREVPSSTDHTGRAILTTVFRSDGVAEAPVRLPHRTTSWTPPWGLPLGDGFLLVGSPPFIVQEFRLDGSPTRHHLAGPRDATVLDVVRESDGLSYLVLVRRGEPGGSATEIWRLELDVP